MKYLQKPKALKHLFSTSNFTSTHLNSFVLEHGDFKTKQLRSVLNLNYLCCKKSLRKNATLNSWTLFSSQRGTCIVLQVPSCFLWKKRVQLFRVAFFRSDFLQNPYFGKITSTELMLQWLWLDITICNIIDVFLSFSYLTRHRNSSFRWGKNS